MKLKVLFATLLAATFLTAFAQQSSPTVTVTQSDEYGPYLTDADGNSLYLFANEDMDMGEARMTEGVRENAVPCTGGCLEAWPPLTAETVQAGEGVDAELLYTAEVEGITMMVYNGWPLYHFARDAAAGDANGQGVGKAPNIWYLVNPEGMAAEGEEEGESGGSGG